MMLGVGIAALKSLGITADWLNDVYENADVLCRKLTVHENADHA